MLVFATLMITYEKMYPFSDRPAAVLFEVCSLGLIVAHGWLLGLFAADVDLIKIIPEYLW